MNFKKLSKDVIPFLNASIFNTNESDRIKFYSVALKNPFKYDKNIQTIIDLVQFFFKQIIECNFDDLDDLDDDDTWTAQFTTDISKIIIEDIARKISQYNNINEMVDSEELNILYGKLSILYRFTTDKKIFPNFDNDLKHKNEIKILHDRDFSNSILLTLLDIFVEFDESFDIKKSLLN